MYYVVLDSTGNAIESFDSLDEARQYLDEIVEVNPDAAEDVAILTYDDHGTPVGDAILVEAPGAGVTAWS